MISSSLNPVTIRGRITEGLKEASFFTNLPWVREQFIIKMGIDPYPGTLNLEVVDIEDVKKLKQLKRKRGIKKAPIQRMCLNEEALCLIE